MNTTLFKKLFAMIATVLYHNMNNYGTGNISLSEVNNLAFHVRDFIDENFVAKDPYNRNQIKHQDLVSIACDSFRVRGAYMSNHKIEAIKELRTTTGVGLKAAKEAVESAFDWNARTKPSDKALDDLRRKLTGE